MRRPERDHMPRKLKTLLNQLISIRPNLREAALAEAHHLSSADLLLVTTAAMRRLRKGYRRWWLWNPVTWIVLIMPGTILVYNGLNRFIPAWLKANECVVMPILLLIAFASLLYMGVIDRLDRYCHLGDVLATRDETYLLGLSLDFHRWRTLYASKPGPLEAIERMVRQMEPDDYALLTAPQKTMLLHFLKSPEAAFDLALALLQSLHPITDRNAMQRVATLAQRAATTPQQQCLRDAAQTCLIAMQQEQERGRQAEALLRPSEAPTRSASHTLLRPALGTETATPPDQLLRAAEPVRSDQNDLQKLRALTQIGTVSPEPSSSP